MHQITNNINNANIVTRLTDFMLNIDNLNKWTKHKRNVNAKTLISKPKYEQSLKNVKAELIDYYKPLQKDSLFWCFYILKYGDLTYEMNKSKHFTIEKEEKYKYINVLKTSKSKELLKMYKIKPYSEIEDDLAHKEQISIKTFFALCLIENINVMLLDNRKIYEHLINDNEKINIVEKNDTYFINLKDDKNITDMYRNTYYNMQGFDNKLKSIASYTIKELLEYCDKLNIDVSKIKNTKKNIYELLLQFF